jgi:membrane protease YdiL (CAAX protease family)
MGPSLLGWTQSQSKYRGGEIMSDNAHTLTDRRLTTPRAAAVAGILFSLLLSAAYILIRISIPANPADGGAWLEERGNTVALALSLVPIAGIAFLWFIGVIRDRIGKLEDKFFSSVFFGSGLLFLAMTFVAAALAGGLLTSYTSATSMPFAWQAYS